MRLRLVCLVLILVLPSGATAQVAGALRAADLPSSFVPGDSLPVAPSRAADEASEAGPAKNFWKAAGGVVFINVGLNLFDRWTNKYNIVDGDTVYWARSDWESIKTNFREGFEWDDNNFSTNQFAHPYHGNLYFNSARANGFNFWESAPFSIAGSFMWEYTGEIYRPAFNDWINTSLGGIALGEMTWRVSSLLLNNESRGFSRALHETAAFLVNPMRGINRVLTGDIHRVGPNPDDHHPSKLGVFASAGYRRIGPEGSLSDGATDHAFLELALRYGNRFDENNRKPFDYFYAEVQLNSRDSSAIGEVRVEGLLATKKVGGGANSTWTVGAYQHFDYFNNLAFQLGGPGFDAALMYDRRFEKSWRLSLEGQAGVMPLGAISSEYGVVVDRTYDYGPGLTGRFEALLRRGDFEVAGIDGELYYITTMNGPPVKHLGQYYRAFAALPILSRFSIGADGTLFKRRTSLDEFLGLEGRTFTSDAAQFRIYASVLLAGTTP